MSTPANDLNISIPGIIAFDGVSTFLGRTITAGAGISVTNGTGISGNPTIALAGGSGAVDSVSVQTGTSPVTPDSNGLLTISGAVVAAGTNPVRTDGTGANTFAVEVQTSQALAAADATKIGLSNFNSSQFSVDSNGFVGSVPFGFTGSSNLGIAYSAGTFTVRSASGSSLSSTNPGYVFLQSKATPGNITRITVTANQTFTDGSAGSIDNQRWDVTTGVDWAQDVPFYLYAVMDDTEALVSFMISRVPHATISPVAASIGKVGAIVNTGQGDFFSLANITVASYDANPCLCLGSFRMQFAGATDSWTVQTLASNDGINQYNDSTPFTMALGQNGAATGTYFLANGGTAPIFTTNAFNYFVRRNGLITCNLFVNGDGGTDGAGAVNSQIALPCNSYAGGNHSILYIETGATALGYMPIINSAQKIIAEMAAASGLATKCLNSFFINGARVVSGAFSYQMQLT